MRLWHCTDAPFRGTAPTPVNAGEARPTSKRKGTLAYSFLLLLPVSLLFSSLSLGLLSGSVGHLEQALVDPLQSEVKGGWQHMEVKTVSGHNKNYLVGHAFEECQ